MREGCLGCQRLENEDVKMVRLVTGKMVCNYCDDYKIECLARSLFKYPLKERRLRIGKLEQNKSKEFIENLKSCMELVFVRLKDGCD